MKHISTRTFVVAGIVVALVLAFLVSPYASSNPDGLERVASDKGFDTSVTDHALADSPLADYSVDGVENTRLGTGLSGIVGVVVSLAIVMGVVMVLKRSRQGRAPPPTPAT